MASDSDASRHKHHRSPSDDEAEKSSKRHKHRHRRHNRCHRSKTHGEASKHDRDEIAPPPPVNHIVANNNRVDDDVEEGEILEEEGSGVSVKDMELREDKTDSQNLVCSVRPCVL